MTGLDIWTPVFYWQKSLFSLMFGVETGSSWQNCSWSIILWPYSSVLQSTFQAGAHLLHCYPSSTSPRRALWHCLHTKWVIKDDCLFLQLLQRVTHSSVCITHSSPQAPTKFPRRGERHWHSPDTSRGGMRSSKGSPPGAPRTWSTQVQP